MGGMRGMVRFEFNACMPYVRLGFYLKYPSVFYMLDLDRSCNSFVVRCFRGMSWECQRLLKFEVV